MSDASSLRAESAARHALHAHFETLHAGSPDPWRYADAWYEVRKRALTLAMLSQPRYRRVFEPGCSIGVFSAALAERCDSLLCWDVSDSALEHARRRLTEHRHVTLEARELGSDLPPSGVDLIVFSELGYYLSPATLAATVRGLEAALSDDGELVACHWRHPIPDAPGHGDNVHDTLRATLTRPHVSSLIEADFRLDLWSAAPCAPTLATRG
ncbi:SAM-dependent methyltransferase [Salinicola aestuarinus]|uniref:SAM-dependent methyltransferase n=1 Tax=Salinicola aestuarinus TaxID=1949082 RepID=UPI000DA23892|nr:SAM-dependent methyltransferase [Salinicola aestuarinus]